MPVLRCVFGVGFWGEVGVVTYEASWQEKEAIQASVVVPKRSFRSIHLETKAGAIEASSSGRWGSLVRNRQE